MTALARFPITLVLTVAVLAGPAASDDRQQCSQVSFAPLDIDIPACSRLIDSNKLSDEQLVNALLSRATAYLFARTYRSGHKIDPKSLMANAAADLDRAVSIARKGGQGLHGLLQRVLSERASLSMERRQPAQAASDYDEILRSFGGQVASTLFGRAMAMKAMRRYDDAVADMDALLRIASGMPNFRNLVFARGEIHEAAGNPKAAIEDFRRTLQLDPKHFAAAAALKRLNVKP